MNARERAEGVMETWRRSWDLGPRLTEEVFLGWIEQAIIQAEEEARRGERETCLTLLNREAKGFQVLIDHAPTPIRAEDLKRVKHSIENVATKIRARSEGEQQQSKGE